MNICLITQAISSSYNIIQTKHLNLQLPAGPQTLACCAQGSLVQGVNPWIIPLHLLVPLLLEHLKEFCRIWQGCKKYLRLPGIWGRDHHFLEPIINLDVISFRNFLDSFQAGHSILLSVSIMPPASLRAPVLVSVLWRHGTGRVWTQMYERVFIRGIGSCSCRVWRAHRKPLAGWRSWSVRSMVQPKAKASEPEKQPCISQSEAEAWRPRV